MGSYEDVTQSKHETWAEKEIKNDENNALNGFVKEIKQWIIAIVKTLGKLEKNGLQLAGNG